MVLVTGTLAVTKSLVVTHEFSDYGLIVTGGFLDRKSCGVSRSCSHRNSETSLVETGGFMDKKP